MIIERKYWYPLTIIGILFFVFGFLTWVNGILIPYLQICLELTNLQALLVVMAAYGSYFFMALPSAWVLKYTGYKKGIGLGLFVMAFGTLLFIPAAYTRQYPIFLLSLFVTGTGLTLLQTAANPYIAIIGPLESTAQRIGIMGLCNKIAGIISITLFGALFLLNADDILVQLKLASVADKATILQAYALKVVNPYLVISLVLVALGVFILWSKLPEVKEEKEETADAENIPSTKTSILQFPHLILGAIAIFCACACEGIPVDGIVLYSRAVGIRLEEARHFATGTLTAMLFGYLFSVLFVPKYISQQRALVWSSILGIVLTIIAYLTGGKISVYCIMLMGFGTAMLWGTIWGLALNNLGRFTKQGSAILLMAVIGGGIAPLLYGKLLDINYSIAVLLLIPCYLFMAYYAVAGHKLK
jgi:MFS transporter, FHS family, L-fucose permease